MLNEGVLEEGSRRLVIDGRKFDVIGFAVDRDNIAEIRRLCSTFNLPALWRSAVHAWARGGREFLVMYGQAEAYEEGSPSVITADTERDFELSIHKAISAVHGCKFYWSTSLDQAHVNQLRLALYVDTHLAGQC